MRITERQCEKVSEYLEEIDHESLEYDHDKPIYAELVKNYTPYFILYGSLDSSHIMEKVYLSRSVYDSLADKLSNEWKDL